MAGGGWGGRSCGFGGLWRRLVDVQARHGEVVRLSIGERAGVRTTSANFGRQEAIRGRSSSRAQGTMVTTPVSYHGAVVESRGRHHCPLRAWRGNCRHCALYFLPSLPPIRRKILSAPRAEGTMVTTYDRRASAMASPHAQAA